MGNVIEGSCHCGNVKYSFHDKPESATDCNCSICRRLGALWIYSDPSNIDLTIEDDDLVEYRHGKGSLVFKTCKNCGCSICWQVADNESADTMAVNLRLASLDILNSIPVRKFDGADTWKFLD